MPDETASNRVGRAAKWRDVFGIDPHWDAGRSEMVADLAGVDHQTAARLGYPTSEPTIEYAVQCTSGVNRHGGIPSPHLDDAAAHSVVCDDAYRTDCGPHRAVQRTVGPWTAVEENEK